jgi:hypothetical protein
MNVRKVAAASVLGAAVSVAGMLGAGMAAADVTDNPTINDSNGYGVANAIHNIIQPAGEHNGIGYLRSDPNQPAPNTIKQACGDACVSTQGNPSSPGVFGPISNAGGNKK